MKHIIVSLLAFFVIFSMSAIDGDGPENNSETSLLYNNYFDPGHKEKLPALNKDKSLLEIYVGSKPSFDLKLNFSGSDGSYLMFGMFPVPVPDHLDDEKYGLSTSLGMHAKFGLALKGKYNNNRAIFPSKQFPWMRAWRYVKTRKSIEIGYQTHFLDGEDAVEVVELDDEGNNRYYQFTTRNYGGVTLNYSITIDAIAEKLLGKHMWWFLDMRTARRVRLKTDIGVFFNLDKFKQPHVGLFSLPSNFKDGTEENPNVIWEEGSDDPDAINYDTQYGDPADMKTVGFVVPFINFSIGIAIF